MPKRRGPKKQWPERRKRLVKLVGGEKRFRELIWIARRRKRKKKGYQQIVSRKTLETGEEWQIKSESRKHMEAMQRIKRHKPAAAHTRGPKKGQKPRREKRKKKKR